MDNKQATQNKVNRVFQQQISRVKIIFKIAAKVVEEYTFSFTKMNKMKIHEKKVIYEFCFALNRALLA